MNYNASCSDKFCGKISYLERVVTLWLSLSLSASLSRLWDAEKSICACPEASTWGLRAARFVYFELALASVVALKSLQLEGLQPIPKDSAAFSRALLNVIQMRFDLSQLACRNLVHRAVLEWCHLTKRGTVGVRCSKAGSLQSLDYPRAAWLN